MFLQLLVLGLSKAPEVDTDVKEGERILAETPKIQTLEDLENLSWLRFLKSPLERNQHNISVAGFERAIIRAKHFTSAELELGEDFV